MAENIGANCPTSSTNFKEAVCVSAGRVYDSCCDRDCLEDMTVFFTEANQQAVAAAQSVRIRSAEVVDVNIDVEPVNFHRGYYTCNMTFFFRIVADLTSAGNTVPTSVTGLAAHQKQVVLYGSEGSVKTFSNLYTAEGAPDMPLPFTRNTPRCTVQVTEPIALSAELRTLRFAPTVYSFPQAVLDLAGDAIAVPEVGARALEVTLGLFSIVQLIRDVQMLVPVYDFSFPEKKCIDTTDSPCDVFRSIDFPTEDFFPPRPCVLPTTGCVCRDTEQ